MRLLEVDEAANHIKDLVDPDANIIWGSAFNNDLDGKIRVSVVATGIEADVSNMPEPSKSFSFPSRSRAEVRIPGSEPAAAPAPIAPIEAPTLDLAEPAAPAPKLAAEDDEDELVLGEETQVSATPVEHEAITAFDQNAADAAPARASGPRRWLQDNDEDAAPAPAPAPSRGGSTLFERMSSMARGSSKLGAADEEEQEETARDPLDIPRFLNRQSNQ
jgi:cell division protein FtsZ